MLKSNGNGRGANAAHVGFEIGLLIKLIDGIIQIISGILMMFVNSANLNKFLGIITQRELSEDPNDMIANFLIGLGHNFSISTRNFAIIYLLSHGAVKIVLIFLMVKKKQWAYPLNAAALGVFISYQLYRFSISGSVTLIVLSVFDAVMIVLTLIEYRRIKNIPRRMI